MVQGVEADTTGLPPQIRIEPLGPQHDRAAFVCSKPHLTQYFTGAPAAKRTLDQDLKYGLARPFVLVDGATGEVLGYFTLCNQSIPKDSLPKKVAAKLGYRDVPTILLGRMAVSEKLAGQGLGSKLLAAALLQAYQITDGGKGCYAVVLDAGEESLLHWYGKRGFAPAPTAQQPRRMVMPMDFIREKIINRLF
ncbi:MAG: GNAT family N-acetyltransferase [Bacteroidota bacterium]|nr:GNAT family N-acetyltransferase [Bacteroidota bacterium]